MQLKSQEGCGRLYNSSDQRKVRECIWVLWVGHVDGTLHHASLTGDQDRKPCTVQSSKRKTEDRGLRWEGRGMIHAKAEMLLTFASRPHCRLRCTLHDLHQWSCPPLSSQLVFSRKGGLPRHLIAQGVRHVADVEPGLSEVCPDTIAVLCTHKGTTSHPQATPCFTDISNNCRYLSLTDDADSAKTLLRTLLEPWGRIPQGTGPLCVASHS
jgi:hypothetical protein